MSEDRSHSLPAQPIDECRDVWWEVFARPVKFEKRERTAVPQVTKEARLEFATIFGRICDLNLRTGQYVQRDIRFVEHIVQIISFRHNFKTKQMNVTVTMRRGHYVIDAVFYKELGHANGLVHR